MIRGTTTEFIFELPYAFSELQLVKIVFWQEDNDGPSSDRPLPIKKYLSHCNPTDNPNELYVTLNQEETLRFTDQRKGYVQFRALNLDGKYFGSKEVMFTVYPTCDESMDIIVPPADEEEIIIFDGGTIA